MFRGIFPALITPFHLVNGSIEIDFESFDKLLEWQISKGVHGVVLYGTTGESPTLSMDEMILLTKRAKEIIKGRIPIIVGGPSNDTNRSIKFIEEIRGVGVDGVLAVVPYYNKPTQEGMFQHFSHLGRVGKTPIIVYNVPGRTVVSIAVDTLDRICKEPNIVAIKEASDSVDRLTEIGALLGDKVSILAGDDGSLAYMLLCNGAGAVTASGCAMPDELLKIYNASVEKDWEGAFKAQADIVHKIRALFLEPNPCPAKTVLRLKGVIKEDTVRLPLVATSKSLEDKLRALYNL